VIDNLIFVNRRPPTVYALHNIAISDDNVRGRNGRRLLMGLGTTFHISWNWNEGRSSIRQRRDRGLTAQAESLRRIVAFCARPRRARDRPGCSDPSRSFTAQGIG